ncbi:MULTISPECIES: TetR/AcrR family transcriptional regulator [unclassified Rhodococcus (in: high G+C Gram-positive bacteria)]|uniref:TetR/AcrR family transcriptional regulator n=1 Tax=unclassified Rhodococcus (in: high G+C Gram-positive bacteria) TaxID=192944 RepID=UPI0015961F82|nr:MULTISPECIES: TetR/AcrR family transcriptional regulator [unclassified Rhodococcus (in: high G+C Gram-positive bacteria)]
MQRSDARSNRARILDVAQGVLANNPDATINDVASAAGVVRRTVYSHFASREALIDGIALEAAERISAALERDPAVDESAVTVFVRQTLALARVGDQYRLLLAVARTTWDTTVFTTYWDRCGSRLRLSYDVDSARVCSPPICRPRC